MRICIDARSLREEKPSGISFYTKELITALLTIFPEHTFVLFSNGFSRSESIDRFRTFKNAEIVDRKIPSKLLHASFTIFGFPSFKSLVGECDVYFFPNVMYAPRQVFPTILTVHDVSYLQMPRAYSLKNHIWYRLVRARTQIRNSDILVTDSKATAIGVSKYVPRRKGALQVVHLALRPPARQVVLQNPEFFLVLGDIDERKNISGILSAYASARASGKVTLPIRFVGKRGYVNLDSHTRKQFEDMKAKGWLQESGYVTDEKKWDLLSRARALIFVSLHEGFGFPGLEAESCGLPIIASNRTSLPEVYGKGPLYVNPENRESIAQALVDVSSPDFPRSMTYDNPLLTRTWKDVAKDMMNIFLSSKQK